MKNTWINTNSDALFTAVLKLETLDEARRFFRDLLTEQEIVEFANRWRVARMLSEKKSYIAIEKETGMSSTTIARISKWLNGKLGGYKLAISKSSNHHLPA